VITEQVAPRVALGLLTAAILLVCVYWLAGSGQPPRLPSGQVARPAGQPRSPEVLASLEGPGVEKIYLAVDSSALPDGVAPVVELVSGGALRLRTAPPAPAAAAPGAPWMAAGVLLPRPQLARLSSIERVGLLDAWAALAAGRGLAVGQIEPLRPVVDPGEVPGLLRWLR